MVKGNARGSGGQEMVQCGVLASLMSELQVASGPSVRRSDRVLPPNSPGHVVTTRHYGVGGGGRNLQLRASPHRHHMLMAPQMGSDCELANHVLFIGFTSLKEKNVLSLIFFFT